MLGYKLLWEWCIYSRQTVPLNEMIQIDQVKKEMQLFHGDLQPDTSLQIQDSLYEKYCTAVTAILKQRGNSSITHSCIHTYTHKYTHTHTCTYLPYAPPKSFKVQGRVILHVYPRWEWNINVLVSGIAVSHLFCSLSHNVIFLSYLLSAATFSNSDWPSLLSKPT